MDVYIVDVYITEFAVIGILGIKAQHEGDVRVGTMALKQKGRVRVCTWALKKRGCTYEHLGTETKGMTKGLRV